MSDILLLQKHITNEDYNIIRIVLYCVFILSAISPYTTGLKALFNPSDCTDTAPTHK